MSGLLTLAGIATALGALVLCVNDIRWRWFGYMDTDRLCDRSPSATTSEYGWGPGWRQQGSYGHPSWLENECREYLEMLTVRTETGPASPGPAPRAAPTGPGAGGPGRGLSELGPRPRPSAQEVLT